MHLGSMKKELAWLDESGLLAHAKSVFVSGSVVRGWGHAQSDLDLYVVCDRAVDSNQMIRFRDEYPHLTEPKVPVAVDWLDGVKLDVEIWQQNQITELVQLMGQEPSTVNWALLVPERYFDTVYRISIAIPLMGDEWLKEAQYNISSGAIATLAAHRALDEADAYLEDAVGFLQSDQDHQAVMAAHIAYGRVVDAIVALAGEYQPGVKWRPQRVKSVGSPDFDEYWKIQTLSELSELGPIEWALRTVHIARRMTGNIEL